MCLEAETKDKALDPIFAAFADQRRRFIIQYLRKTSDGVASFDELVEYVGGRCADIQDSETVKSCLHHVSLPKLEKADVIEYDPRSETVRYQPHPVVEDLAELLGNIED